MGNKDSQNAVGQGGRKKRKPLVLGLIAIVVLLFVISRIGKNHTGDQPTAAENAVAVTAVNLKSAYDQNEVKADNDYKGHVLKVSGTIISIGNDILDHPYVVINDGKDEYEMTGVQCTFEDKKIVASLNKGQKIEVTGVCNGKMMNILMDKCHL